MSCLPIAACAGGAGHGLGGDSMTSAISLAPTHGQKFGQDRSDFLGCRDAPTLVILYAYIIMPQPSPVKVCAPTSLYKALHAGMIL